MVVEHARAEAGVVGAVDGCARGAVLGSRNISQIGDEACDAEVAALSDELPRAAGIRVIWIAVDDVQAKVDGLGRSAGTDKNGEKRSQNAGDASLAVKCLEH